jgi:hypothetical protein
LHLLLLSPFSNPDSDCHGNAVLGPNPKANIAFIDALQASAARQILAGRFAVELRDMVAELADAAVDVHNLCRVEQGLGGLLQDELHGIASELAAAVGQAAGLHDVSHHLSKLEVELKEMNSELTSVVEGVLELNASSQELGVRLELKLQSVSAELAASQEAAELRQMLSKRLESGLSDISKELATAVREAAELDIAKQGLRALMETQLLGASEELLSVSAELVTAAKETAELHSNRQALGGLIEAELLDISVEVDAAVEDAVQLRAARQDLRIRLEAELLSVSMELSTAVRETAELSLSFNNQQAGGFLEVKLRDMLAELAAASGDICEIHAVVAGGVPRAAVEFER